MAGEQQWQQNQHLPGIFAYSHTPKTPPQHTHYCSCIFHIFSSYSFPSFLYFFVTSIFAFLYFGRFSANRKIDSADVCECCLHIPKTTFREHYTEERRTRNGRRITYWPRGRERLGDDDATDGRRIVLHGEKSKTQLRLLWGKVFLRTKARAIGRSSSSGSSSDRAIQRSTEGTRNRRGLGLNRSVALSLCLSSVSPSLLLSCSPRYLPLSCSGSLFE